MFSSLRAFFVDKKIACIVTSAGAILSIVLWLRTRNRVIRPRKDVPKNTVLVYQVSRGQHIPSPIPYVMKLETYLRMNNIPYMTDHHMVPGPKGKWPWIQYNGQIVTDSEFIILYLNFQRDQDMNKALSSEQQAIGWAMQKMIEENAYWAFVLDRMVYDETEECYGAWDVPNVSFIRNSLRKQVITNTHAQGMGRHTKQEVLNILRRDLKSVSEYLGSKKYLFGEEPSTYDCAIFGLLSEMVFESFSGFQGKVVREFPNLVSYCNRIQEKYWPDWQQCMAGNDRKKPRSRFT